MPGMLRHSVRLISLATILLIANSALAQGTAKDYANAYGFRERFAGKVLNETIRPAWIEGQDAFTYQEAKPGGEKWFWLVDAVKGVKSEAFDHSRVADALKKATGKEVNPSRLPFDRVTMSPDRKKITIRFEGTKTIDLATYKVTTGGASQNDGLKAFAPEEVPSSGGGGERATIRFVNQSTTNLKIWWLMDDGTKREYKEITPGEQWGIDTWESHYWVVTTVAGEALAVYKPSLDGGTAYLDGKRVPYQAPPRVEPGTSPDGQVRVVFRNQQAALIRGTGSPEPLTTDGTAENRYQGPVIWSPDGQRAMFYQVVPEERRPLNIVFTTPRDQFQPRLQTTQYLKPGDRVAQHVVCIFDRQTGKVTKVPDSSYEGHFDLGYEQWLDKDRFTFRANGRGHQWMRVIEFNAATNQTRTVIEETAKTFIDWTQKSFYQVVNGGKEAIWQSERSGWCHLYLYDIATGKVKNAITSGEWVVRRIDRVDEAKRQIWFYASGLDDTQDPYHLHYCRVNFDGSGFTRLTEADGNHRISLSPSGKYALATYSRVDLPPVHEVRRLSDGKFMIQVERADASELIQAGFQMPKRFVAKARDGVTNIWGIIHVPTNFDRNKKYPVVEDIYAGPHSAHVPKDWHTNSGAMQVAELGFITVRIDGMGTSQRSKAFHDVAWQNIADAGFPDRKIWIQEAAKIIPQMDLSRVGIYGTSAGGQNTLHALLLHGDFYKVGVADCGCYDNRMDKIWWNEQWMGYPIGPHYEAQSGRTLAKNLTGKLLLLLGEVDTNVDPASTYQVVDALIAADKDFDFVTIPNVGHGAVGHPYGRRKLYDFLVRHLHGVEPRR